MIEIQSLGPTPSSHIAILFKKGGLGFIGQVIEGLGNVHQRITRNGSFKVQNTGEPYRSFCNLGQQVSSVQIVIAEHRMSALVQEVRPLRNICRDPPRKADRAAAVCEFLELSIELEGQIGPISRVLCPYSVWTDIAECLHWDPMKFLQQLPYLGIGGDELLRCQCRLEPPQY